MKRSIIFKSILVIIILIFILNFNKIKFLLSFININEKDSIVSEDNNDSPADSSKEQNNNPLKDLIESENSSDASDNVGGEEETTNSENNTEDQVSSNVDSVKKEDKNTHVNKNRSLQSIANEYNGKFEALQDEFMNSLDNMVHSAYSDYKSGETSKSKLLSKYLDLGASLESRSDKKFFSLLDKMKGELKKNGHPTDITKEIESYYKSAKSSKKKEFLKKASSNM